MKVQLFDTATPLEGLEAELVQAAANVVKGKRYILGPEVSAFEQEFSGYLGVNHAIGVANGTEALTIALRAVGVKPGDHVVVPSYTFYASAEAIVSCGAVPVFCDIDPTTFCLTADTVKMAITDRTKAIVAVHLYGNVAPIDELKQFGLPIVEDAAQSAGTVMADGRRPGGLGAVATFSFFPSKNLGCIGDGGAITTNDDSVADLVRTLRFHGSKDKVTFELVGYNSRLDEIQAAFLRIMLPQLDHWSDRRRWVAERYEQLGLGEFVDLPIATDGSQPAWHLYTVATERADELSAALTAVGVGNRGYYRVPIHRQPAMAGFAPRYELSGTEMAARRGLAIPMHAALTEVEIGHTVSSIAANIQVAALKSLE